MTSRTRLVAAAICLNLGVSGCATDCPGTAVEVVNKCGCDPVEASMLTRAHALSPVLQTKLTECLSVQGAANYPSKGHDQSTANVNLGACIERHQELDATSKQALINLIDNTPNEIDPHIRQAWNVCYARIIAPGPIVSPPASISERISSMQSNMSANQYTEADLIADEILKSEPDNIYALNTKGSVKYYKGDFQSAATYFAKARKVSPKNFAILCNLGDTYVELGDFPRALKTYNSVDDSQETNDVWWFSIGRASLYAKNYRAAIENLQLVPDNFKKGSARILEAAALLASSGGIRKANKDDLAAVRDQLRRGMANDSEFWNKIFHDNWKDPEYGHSIEISLLKPLLELKTKGGSNEKSAH